MGAVPRADGRAAVPVTLQGLRGARAFSSAGESIPLIRGRSLVRVQKGPWRGDVAQVGERLPCTEEGRGSNPLISMRGD